MKKQVDEIRKIAREIIGNSGYNPVTYQYWALRLRIIADEIQVWQKEDERNTQS